MPRGTKRSQLAEAGNVAAKSPGNDTTPIGSPEKKKRMNANLVLFEKMKKEAEENRRRVRDEYLKNQEMAEAVTPKSATKPRRETIAAVSGSRTPIKTTKVESGVKKSASKAKPAALPMTPKVSSRTPVKSPVKTVKPIVAVPSPIMKTATPLPSPVKEVEVEVTEDAADTAEENKASIVNTTGNLYPYIAVSDFFCAAGHCYAALLAFRKNDTYAAFGFLSVFLASMVGCLRFGVDESKFLQANCDLGNIAGFVGFPLIGMRIFIPHYKLEWDMTIVAGMLIAWEALTRTLKTSTRDNLKALTNVVLFVLPILVVCKETKDYHTMVAMLVWVFAGLVITPHQHNCIGGMRCINWFHYLIGIVSYFLAKALPE